MSNPDRPHTLPKFDFKTFSKMAKSDRAQPAEVKRIEGMPAGEKKSEGGEGEEGWTLVDSEKERIAKELKAKAEVQKENALLDEIGKMFVPTLSK